MCLIRITMANLCPNMIHFNTFDFSEGRSEEVISFFWCSVYITLRLQSMEKINSEISHSLISTFFKHFIILLDCNFSEFNFTPYLRHW